MFAPRTLSLFGEKSERGRLGCGMGSSGRAIIVYNRLTFADFGAILVKVGFRGQFQGLRSFFCAVFGADEGKLGLPISFSLACTRARARYLYIYADERASYGWVARGGKIWYNYYKICTQLAERSYARSHH